MDNTNIDAHYAGSLILNVAYVFSELFFSFYIWCVTKVAHGMPISSWLSKCFKLECLDTPS